jgi:hypothetical protein
LENKKIFLHIGAHKTASTWLQGILKSIAPQLEEQDICFDLYGTEKIKEINYVSSPPLTDKQAISYKSWFERRFKGIKNTKILLSTEKIIGRHFQCYSNSSRMAELLQMIFGDYQTKIICYVRRQDTFIESLYNQGVRENVYKKSFGETVRGEMDIFAFDWNAVLNNFSAQFGMSNVHAIYYENLKHRLENYVKPFFDLMEFDYSNIDFDRYPPRNCSLTQDGLRLAMKNQPTSINHRKTPFKTFDYMSEIERKQLMEYYE